MANSASRSGTLSLSVAHIGFMLERMAMDCGDLQFLRELTQNSIESILRLPSKEGQIVWDVDWPTFEQEGVYKLSITDNGDGMSGDDMIQHINHLSSSGATQAHNKNFGVGAKISAATRNPAGLIYLSWRKKAGSMIYFWRDPESAEYGLQQLRLPNGDYTHCAPLQNSVKPTLIRDHGTRVILYGVSKESNTMVAPEGASSPSRWVTKYLNTRYFRFPKDITVKAREGWEFERSDTDRNVLRTIIGQKKYFDEHATHSGIVRLANAQVHWWILRKEPALTQNSGFIASQGHCAALWKDELYEMTTGRSSTIALQNFGIPFGYQQIVLYVEPVESAGIEILTNTARTSLLFNGNPLPWTDWQDEFRNSIPTEISTHIENSAAASLGTDHKDSIRDRLREIDAIFKLSRYRPAKNGEFLVSEETQAAGGGNRTNGTGGKNEEHGSEFSGKNQSVYSLFLTTSGIPGSETRPDAYPRTMWVSVLNGTRPAGDMEDRAAKYLEKDNLLLINADFRVFTDMIDRWTNIYSTVPGAQQAVTDTVREWFEQSLVEAVLSSNALRNSEHWSIEHVRQMLSEEALTTVILPRWHIEQNVKRLLNKKLGTPIKGKAA